MYQTADETLDSKYMGMQSEAGLPELCGWSLVGLSVECLLQSAKNDLGDACMMSPFSSAEQHALAPAERRECVLLQIASDMSLTEK